MQQPESRLFLNQFKNLSAVAQVKLADIDASLQDDPSKEPDRRELIETIRFANRLVQSVEDMLTEEWDFTRLEVRVCP